MLLILALATSVSVLTTISLAAIATNLRVGGGGVYFLISRTLGPAFGGAIGIVLYLAMSVSIAFYTIGLGEAVAAALGLDDPAAPRAIAAVAIVALLGLAWLGADIATRLQYVVMVALVVAIVAYFVGVGDDLEFGRLSEGFTAPEGGDTFWVSFALFFPAVTGFTQGVAMSGDLATPSRSISRGTFAAIGVSTVIYLLVIVSFVMAVPLDVLRDDTSIMRSLAPAPWLIDIGVIAATLSSAIASMLGAPRTLQRLAADRLIRPLEPFAVGAGPASNPRRGVALSAGIALFTVALGDLDVVAPVISMFFLASYGLINYATYSEARAGSTSFRPRFRFFDWRLSLLGTLGCLGAILAIDPLAGALAAVALFALFRYLSRTVQQVRWADSTRGFHTSEVRTHLAQMGPHGDPGRDWRPCTVAFAPRDPDRRARLATLATWFEGNAGFTTVTRVVTGRGPMVRKRAARVELELQRELAARPDTIYGRVIVGETREDGVAAMLQAHGIGALRANLALFSWYHADDPARPNAATTAAMVQTAIRFGCSVGIAHTPDGAWETPAERHRGADRGVVARRSHRPTVDAPRLDVHSDADLERDDRDLGVGRRVLLARRLRRSPIGSLRWSTTRAFLPSSRARRRRRTSPPRSPGPTWFSRRCDCVTATCWVPARSAWTNCCRRSTVSPSSPMPHRRSRSTCSPTMPTRRPSPPRTTGPPSCRHAPRSSATAPDDCRSAPRSNGSNTPARATVRRRGGKRPSRRPVRAQRTYLDPPRPRRGGMADRARDRPDRSHRRGRSRAVGPQRRRLSPRAAGALRRRRSGRPGCDGTQRSGDRPECATSVRRSIGRCFEGYASSTTRSSSRTRSSYSMLAAMRSASPSKSSRAIILKTTEVSAVSGRQENKMAIVLPVRGKPSRMKAVVAGPALLVELLGLHQWVLARGHERIVVIAILHLVGGGCHPTVLLHALGRQVGAVLDTEGPGVNGRQVGRVEEVVAQLTRAGGGPPGFVPGTIEAGIVPLREVREVADGFGRCQPDQAVALLHAGGSLETGT